jgi:hypothetical protein
MRYGYWLPVFGGWLRNVDDEQMRATWEYNSRLAKRSEEIGYDLTLIAELNLNDIKGVEAPSLDAWSTAAALAAVTERLELMVAVRPTFHQPALLAKQATTSTTSAVAEDSHLMSFLHGGLMKLKSTELNLNNTTIAMLARRNGWRLSIDYGVKIMFHLAVNTMQSTIA